MREIEFRAWTGLRMIDWDELQTLHIHTVFKMCSPELTIMQFTGIRDKNGVKIFCGDIVEADGIDYESGNYARGEIVFIDGEFSIQYMHLDRNLYERIISAKRESVVGNKHQHPQLLEQKK